MVYDEAMNIEVAKRIGKARQVGHRHPPGADGDCIAYECQTCREWISEYAEQTLCPENWTSGYTVDDLLAWLRERYRFVSIDTIDWGTPYCDCEGDGCAHEQIHEGWTVRLSHVGASDDDVWISPKADRSYSLLESLEAAVLRVSERSGRVVRSAQNQTHQI